MQIETKDMRVDLAKAGWRKSTRSSGNGNCVEVAFIGEAVAVRDSKNPDQAPMIYTRAEWDAFIGGAKNGEFDLS